MGSATTWTRQADLRYLISGFVLVEEHQSAVASGEKDLLGKYAQNRFPPWLTDDLTFAAGEAVVVAAPPSLARELDRVVAIADDAAKRVARFRAMGTAEPLRLDRLPDLAMHR
jgi:hypothetical protein